MFGQMLEKFNELHGGTGPVLQLFSPGRVNLIGEHTDYNGGFVFPAAIDMGIYCAASGRDDDRVSVFSLDFNASAEFSLSDTGKEEGSWTNYVKGVISELRSGYDVKRGFNAVFASTLPVGSGLSSSAAFELINCLLLSRVNALNIPARDQALLCQAAENRFVGVNCGIMDQFAIALGRKGSALFLDTRSLEYEAVPLNMSGYRIVIGNTNKPRTLAGSAYNKRRAECMKAVKAVAERHPLVESLRDVTPGFLEEIRRDLDPVIYRRARHVIYENKRVEESVESLKAGDLDRFGLLMTASHDSLRDFYSVSCLELDIMVEEALSVYGTAGSRMTGAGFGGCTVNLVKDGRVDQFMETVGRRYKERTGKEAEFYVTEAVEGTHIING